MSAWRLSPHPPGADRPWRAVGIYAWHGVRSQVSSLAFWLLILLFPVLTIGMSVSQAVFETPTTRVVIVPDAALRAHAEAALTDSAWEVAERAAQAGPLVTLQLDGTPAAFTASLRSTDPDEDLQREESGARWVVDAVREQIWLQPGEREALVASVAAPDAATTREDARMLIARNLLPGSSAFALFLAGMAGAAAAGRLQQQRDDPFFRLLQTSTPASVMYLGGMLESVGLSVLWTLPYLLPSVVLAGVLLAADYALVGPAQTLAAALFLVATFFTTVGAVAGARTVLTGVGDGVPGLSVLGAIWPILVFPLFSRGATVLAFLETPWARPLCLLPVLGVVPSAIAARDASWGWVAAGCAVQVLGALGLVRLGAWAHGLEEPPLSTLRRRWRAR